MTNTVVGAHRQTSRRTAAGALALIALLACREAPPPEVAALPVDALYRALVSDDREVVAEAAARIEEREDRRFVAVLIELLRASQLGIAGRSGYNRRVVALERLAGESFGGDWFAWAEWYAGTTLSPPPGFAAFKAELFAKLDPAYATLLAASRPSELRLEEIHWGGVPVDGIPALDDPAFVPAGEADFLAADEPVVGLEVEGDARAYPLRILDWHELVNDRVGGVPIALAYCTLCGSAIAYEGRAGDGRTLRFGTSGLLYGSNKLMFDRETRTLWSQLRGRPVLGPLVGSGLALSAHPAVVTRFADWRARHPDTRVLSLDTGYERDYRPGNPYGGYFASPQKLFPVFEARRDLPAKARVFGLALGGAAKAFPLPALLRERVLNDRVGDQEVVLLADGGALEVVGESELVGAVRYDAGAAVRAYRRIGRRFRPGPDAGTLLDEADRAWRAHEDALRGPDGARAERLAGTLAYWFAWQSFHPRTLVYGE